MYSGIAAGLPENGVKALRHELWQEHLGLTSPPDQLKTLPADPTSMTCRRMGTRRHTPCGCDQERTAPPADQRAAPVALEAGDRPEGIFDVLKIRTSSLRSKAQFDFKTRKVDDKKSLLPWPII
ncbi:MAG: hypothetical protein MRJ92_11030 [Nitrospira sp.]|nr:hypothetical protein [Nitrospira sp.]